jgi:molybdopterin converting factor small subunit
LQLAGATPRALLHALHRKYPALYRCICDERGALRRHIQLFINNDFIRDRDELDTKLKPGDVVSVFQAVSGG